MKIIILALSLSSMSVFASESIMELGKQQNELVAQKWEESFSKPIMQTAKQMNEITTQKWHQSFKESK